MKIEFKIDGLALQLDADTVQRSLRGQQPEPIRNHAVRVAGVLYPMKQAFALATGLDRLDFTTNQARTQFKRLGFDVVRIERQR